MTEFTVLREWPRMLLFAASLGSLGALLWSRRRFGEAKIIEGADKLPRWGLLLLFIGPFLLLIGVGMLAQIINLYQPFQRLVTILSLLTGLKFCIICIKYRQQRSELRRTRQTKAERR